jgi:hypothetical protein
MEKESMMGRKASRIVFLQWPVVLVLSVLIVAEVCHGEDLRNNRAQFRYWQGSSANLLDIGWTGWADYPGDAESLAYFQANGYYSDPYDYDPNYYGQTYFGYVIGTLAPTTGYSFVVSSDEEPVFPGSLHVFWNDVSINLSRRTLGFSQFTNYGYNGMAVHGANVTLSNGDWVSRFIGVNACDGQRGGLTIMGGRDPMMLSQGDCTVSTQYGMSVDDSDVTIRYGGCYQFWTAPCTIGGAEGTTSMFTVEGEGSRCEVLSWGEMPTFFGQVYVGGGEASMTVRDGGLAKINRILLGYEAGNQGVLNIDAGTVNNADTLLVGAVGTGVLNMGHAGRLLTSNMIVADESGSIGRIEMNANSVMEVSHLLSVGDAGTGEMKIAGSSVTAETLRVGGTDVNAGTGALTICGDGTGPGSLHVQGEAYFAEVEGATADVSVCGPGGAVITGIDRPVGSGSSFTAYGTLHVGSAGQATMNIEDTGRCSSSNATLAQSSTGVANVTLKKRALWANTNGIYVGEGQTDITVSDQSQLITNVFRMDYPTRGVLTVDGADSLFSCDTCTLDASQPSWVDHASSAQLLVQNSGHASITSLLDLSGNALVSVRNGGTILIGHNAMDLAPGVVGISEGGTLSGTGTIEGRIVLAGGTISPGHSPGTLTCDELQADSGEIIMEIAGMLPGQYDVIHVLGDADLGGTLRLSFIDGFLPKQGDILDLILCDGLLTGSFDRVIVSGVNSDWRYNLSPETLPGTIRLSALTDAVPEPLTLAMLALGGVAMLRRRAA